MQTQIYNCFEVGGLCEDCGFLLRSLGGELCHEGLIALMFACMYLLIRKGQDDNKGITGTSVDCVG